MMEWIFPSKVKCVSCRLPIPRSNTYSLCKGCFEQIRFRGEREICTFYEGPMMRLIHAFKYSDRTYLAKIFAQILYEKYQIVGQEADYLVSVPASKKRLMQRGYNQSELLCEELSVLTGIAHLPIFKRVKETLPLSGLDPLQRAVEISGAFGLKENLPEFRGKKFLLIDDILTTGATISELLLLLRGIGSGVEGDFMVLSSNKIKKDGGDSWI